MYCVLEIGVCMYLHYLHERTYRHLYCYHGISVVLLSDLHQVLVDPSKFQRQIALVALILSKGDNAFLFSTSQLLIAVCVCFGTCYIVFIPSEHVFPNLYLSDHS